MARSDLLFSKYDLRGNLELHRKKAEAHVDGLSGADLRPENEDKILKHLGEEYLVKPLALHEDKVTIEQEEAQVDVSRDPMRAFLHPGRPFYIPGLRLRYCVPYTGDKALWNLQPTTFNYNPPVGEITDTDVVLEFLVPRDKDVAETKPQFDAALRRLQEWIGFSRNGVDQYNAELMPALKVTLARRREAVVRAQAGVERLGIPIRPRSAPGATRPPVGPAPQPTGRKQARTKFDYDVALSFAGEDRAYVEQVAEVLKTAGVRVFYDRYEQADLWGKNLADHLGEVYGKRSRFVVLFISKHYPLKSWPTHERQSAQATAIPPVPIIRETASLWRLV